MRFSVLLIAIFAGLLASCGSGPSSTTPSTATKAEAPKPSDESSRFPRTNLINTEVINTHLMGKLFMPGGTLAHYKKGKSEYEMFVAKLPTAEDAAILLPDWNKTLGASKLIPSFGGYFGDDAGRPLFVFSKGSWIAGVVGLPEKQADLQARILAEQLD